MKRSYMMQAIVCVVALAGMILMTACHDLPTNSDPTGTVMSSSGTDQVTVVPTDGCTEPTVEFVRPEDYPDITTYGYITEPPVLPVPAEDANEEEWIAFFYGLLSKSNSWYCIGLNSFYETTADMDIGLIFAAGITFKNAQLTDEEVAHLQVDPESIYFYNRIPRVELNAVLQLYFNTTLDACINLENWIAQYLAETDCYYTINNGAPIYAGVYGIIGYSTLENGDYVVQYMSDIADYPYGPAEVVLHRVGDHFQIVANRRLEE